MGATAESSPAPWLGSPDTRGRAMVLIHGAGGTHAVWENVRRELQGFGIPVLALDLPGHGRNSAPAPDTVEERADAVGGILSSAGVRECVVAGHSLGGAVALALAARQDDRIRGFAAISSGLRMPVDPLILKGIREAFACTVDNLARFLFARGAAPSRIDQAAELLRSTGPQTLHSDFSACAAYRLDADRLAAIQIPAAIVTGSADVLTPPSLAEELAAGLPRAHLTLLPEAGHMPLLEDPKGLAAALASLWNRSFPGNETP